MNEPLDQKIREAAWRRKLTATEEAEWRAWLAAHPEARADGEAEMALSEQLGRLPEAPVSSNFTARVLRAVERERAVARRADSPWSWVWRSFLPKAAVAAVFLLVTFGSYRGSVAFHQQQLAQKAESVAVVSEVAALPDPETLLYFDAIRQLNAKPSADRELLTVFSLLQ